MIAASLFDVFVAMFKIALVLSTGSFLTVLVISVIEARRASRTSLPRAVARLP